MRIVRNLLFAATFVVAAGCLAATILIAPQAPNDLRDESVDLRTAAWERLGAGIDADLPLDTVDAPGVAHVVDPNLAHARQTCDVIDEELPDASPEEREIWRTELAQRSPEEIREIMGLHRRLSPAREHAQIGDVEFVAPASAAPQPPQPLAEATVASANRIWGDLTLSSSSRDEGHGTVSAGALRLIDSAIEADLAAEQVILNNIANANTVGFKRSRALFGDLPCRRVSKAETEYGETTSSTPGMALGGGGCLTTQADHSQGRLRHTERSLDMAIQGDGYFQIKDGDRTMYTRRGSFGLNASGELVLMTSDRNRPIEPAAKVPPDTVKIVVSPSGTVSVLEVGQAKLTAIGQLQLCRFTNSEALAPCGEGLFAPTEACGTPTVAPPGQSGLGEIRQGALEESNVASADELSELRRVQEHLKTLRELRAELGGSKDAP